MKTIKDVGKDMILAGLGSMDQKNEELKDLLRRGSEIFGMGEVENEELLYDGNRERIMAEREAKKRENSTYDLGNGTMLYYEKEVDDEGNITGRNVEVTKTPSDTGHSVNLEFEKGDAGESRLAFSEKKESLTNGKPEEETVNLGKSDPKQTISENSEEGEAK